jgi:hypothetical protein
MDPEACLARAESALEDNDHEEAADALEDYRQWRSCGGFEPLNGDARANELRRKVHLA